MPDFRLIPVLSSMEHLDFFLNQPSFKHLPLCLKFNIGMNRLGISCSDVEHVAKKIKRKDEYLFIILWDTMPVLFIR